MSVYAPPRKRLSDPFFKLYQEPDQRNATENTFPDYLSSGIASAWIIVNDKSATRKPFNFPTGEVSTGGYEGIGTEWAEEEAYSFPIISITSVSPIQLRKGNSQDDAMMRLEIAAQAGNEKNFIKVANSIDWSQRPAVDYLNAIQMALEAGAYLKARKLAEQSATQYPDEIKLQKIARILAPPKVTRSSEPPDPTLRLNRDWLREHSEEYRGQWVALKAGQLLAVGESPKELKKRLGDTKKILLTKVFLMLYFEDRQPFSTGMVSYQYQPVQVGDNTPRIILPVQIGEQLTSAFVDTGGAFFICDPNLVDELHIDPKEALDETVLRIRGVRYDGRLYRLQVTLQAEEGDPLSVDATVFIPELRPNQPWELSSIIGLTGFLERIRFAVDPADDRFYFGVLDEDRLLDD
jgi:hypothetical protein